MTLHHAEPRRRYDALAAALGAVGIDVPAEAAEAEAFAAELTATVFARQTDVDHLLDRAEQTSGGKRTDLIDTARDALTLAAARRMHGGDVGDVLSRRAARSLESARARIVGDDTVASRAAALYAETAEAFAADWATVGEIVAGRVDDVDDLGALVGLGLDGPTAARLAQAHIAARGHAATLDALAEVRAHLPASPRGRLTSAEATTLALVAAEPAALGRIVGAADRVPSGLAGWGHVLAVGAVPAWATEAQHAERVQAVLTARSEAASAAAQRPASARDVTRNDLEVAALDRRRDAAGTDWERGQGRTPVTGPITMQPNRLG